MSEDERNAKVYVGEILVFRGFAPVARFIEALRSRSYDYLGDNPTLIHDRRTEDEIARASAAFRRAVRSDSAIAAYFNAALAAVGVRLDDTYGDGVVVRVQTAGLSRNATLGPLAAHRDTWGTNIAAQTNWWAPLFPATPERTLALFPAYFDYAVANSSADWDFEELLRRLKAGRTAEKYPLLPTASDAPPRAEALPISLVPGDLMCFSSAHLHASVPNTTDRTRLSVESRTVNGTDVAAKRGAPDVDGSARYTTYQLFRHLDGVVTKF
ncbi:hypothetical protein [Kushneria aurantia]|uniref:Phytanoyl-CoA dioxygenase n=1 Tax=Kushneria aurantia TaxID=504092 RepID=A0ABV6G3A3_9GAMM|nr:hypothetical protein [Kushneria aurantia]